MSWWLGWLLLYIVLLALVNWTANLTGEHLARRLRKKDEDNDEAN